MMDDPQRELKQWLAEKVRPHGEAKKLAAATGLSSDKVTRSKELESTDPKKRRTLQHDEIRAIATYFRELPPGYEGMTQWLHEAEETPSSDAPPNRLFESFDPDNEEWSGEPPQDGAAILDGKLLYRRKLEGGTPETSAAPGAGLGMDEGIDVGVGAKGIATGHEVVDEWVIPPSYARHTLGARPTEIVIMPVVGHSMRPLLEPNDRVLVDVSQNVFAGDAVYVIDDGDKVLQVKTVKKVLSSQPPMFKIVSEASPEADDPPLRGDQFRIVGRVVGRFTKM